MSRYGKFFAGDSPMEGKGDAGWVGVKMGVNAEDLPAGYAQDAQNKRFVKGEAVTRGGTVTPAFGSVALSGESRIYGTGVFSDPEASDEEWLMAAVGDGVWLLRDGRYPRKVRLGAGLSITGRVRLVQTFDKVLMFRGDGLVELEWDGSAGGKFREVEQSDSGTGTNPIPWSDFGVVMSDRLLVVDGRDAVAISDPGDYTRYDDILSAMRFNSGSTDYITAVQPYAQQTALVWKNSSVFAGLNIKGDMSGVGQGEVSRVEGCVSPDSVVLIGGRAVGLSANGRLISVVPDTGSPTERYVVEPVAFSEDVRPYMERLNGAALSGVCAKTWGDYVFWAVPLDGSTYNDAILVWNRTTGLWQGCDVRGAGSGFRVDSFEVSDYLGRKRLFAFDWANCRMMVLEEGEEDVVGSVTWPISDYVTTRAYTLGSLGLQRADSVMLTLKTRRPSVTVTGVTGGVNEEKALLSAWTRDRTKYEVHGKADYVVTNVGGDFGVERRQDYVVLSGDAVRSNSGVEVDWLQEARLAMPVRMVGRGVAFKIANGLGVCAVRSVLFEGLEVEYNLREAI